MSSKTKEKLLKTAVPTYSKGEEIFNSISHLLGAIFGIFTLVFFISKSISNNYSFLDSFSLLFYSFTIILLYFNSTIYHSIDKDSPWKRVFRLLDHNTIYWLIVGTYFPICVFGLKGSVYGLIIMIIEFSCLLIGSLLNFFNMHKTWVKVLTTIIYVVMGWTIGFIFPAVSILPLNVFLLVLAGGVSYTVGVLFYIVGKKKKWMHSVFHIFCLLGTILQFIAILILI